MIIKIAIQNINLNFFLTKDPSEKSLLEYIKITN